MASSPTNALSLFLRDLFEHGRVTVDEELRQPAAFLDQVAEQLQSLDLEARLHLPRGWPAFDEPAACYGAVVLYRACQFLTFRHLPPQAIAELIVVPSPRPNPAEHASVDLVLRFLPDMVRLARSAASEDPLVVRLLELARRWPLSSVGIQDLGEVDPAPLLVDRATERVYIDRILATGDRSRLSHPRVRMGVRAAVGSYPELAGRLPLEEPVVEPKT